MGESRFAPRADSDLEDQEKLEKRLFDQILAKGTFDIETIWPEQHGMTVKSDPRMRFKRDRFFSFNELNGHGGVGEFQKYGITEILVLKSLTEPVYEDVKTGIFGKKERKRVRNTKLDLSRFVPSLNGDAYSIVYTTVDMPQAIYREPVGPQGGRAGQSFTFRLMLPKELAVELWEYLKKDPIFAREIAKKLIVEQFHISEQSWEQGNSKSGNVSLCPPYGKWKSSGAGNFYLHDMDTDKWRFNQGSIVRDGSFNTEIILKEWLSYGDADLESEEKQNAIEQNLANPQAKKYATAMLELIGLHGSKKVKALAEKLHRECLMRLTKYGISPNPYTRSLSWAFWDMAKQYYFYTHTKEADENYSIADPFSLEKQKEIVNRHVGWEAYNNRGPTTKFHIGISKMPDSREKAQILFLIRQKQSKPNGTLSSFDLAKLGALLN